MPFYIVQCFGKNVWEGTAYRFVANKNDRRFVVAPANRGRGFDSPEQARRAYIVRVRAHSVKAGHTREMRTHDAENASQEMIDCLWRGLARKNYLEVVFSFQRLRMGSIFDPNNP
jgi:hypothetical protein